MVDFHRPNHKYPQSTAAVSFSGSENHIVLNHFCAILRHRISITKLFTPGDIVNGINTWLKVYWMTPGGEIFNTDDINVRAEAFPLES